MNFDPTQCRRWLRMIDQTHFCATNGRCLPAYYRCKASHESMQLDNTCWDFHLVDDYVIRQTPVDFFFRRLLWICLAFGILTKTSVSHLIWSGWTYSINICSTNKTKLLHKSAKLWKAQYAPCRMSAEPTLHLRGWPTCKCFRCFGEKRSAWAKTSIWTSLNLQKIFNNNSQTNASKHVYP